MIYWKFKYSRTQRALAVGVSERVNAFRHRKRQKDKYKDEQLELLKQENDLLRERLKELRLNHKVVC